MADTKPGIFISHTGADAPLANEVGRLIKRVFAGAIVPWYSSDASPRGGLAPGDEWFGELHAQLRSAAQVFAIVTPRSVERPWIYWESGIGSVACANGVTAVLFGVDPKEVGPPLSYFQGMDGLSADGLRAGLAKVGAQADLAPDEEILAECVSRFVQAASELMKQVEPRPRKAAQPVDPLAGLYGPLQNIAERLDRLERQATARSGRRTKPPEPRAVIDGLRGDFRGIAYLAERLEAGDFGLADLLDAFIRHSAGIAIPELRPAQALAEVERVFAAPEGRSETEGHGTT